MTTVIFCVDCEQIITPESSKRCPSITSKVEGYKGGMHWYAVKNVEQRTLM